MKALKTILVLIIVIGLTVNTACFSNVNTKDGNVKLTIYVMENDTFLRNVIRKFNSDHKEITIEEKVYYSDQYEKYSEDIQASLLSDSGSDIVVTSPVRIPMLSKYIDNSSFGELDDLYNNDKNINKDDIYNEIMNYGIYKGKRYLIPLSYTIDALFTTRSILDEKGITGLDSDVSWEDISQICSEYQKKNQKESQYILSNLEPSSLIRGLGNNIIDLENKAAKLDTAAVKEAIKLYKTINKSVIPDKVFYEKIKDGDISAILRNKDAIFLNSAITSPRNLRYNYSLLNTGIQPQIYTACTVENKISPKVTLFGAINSKCTHKKEAYEFISTLLSKDYQANNFLNGLPISKSAYEQEKDRCLEEKANNSIKTLLPQVDGYLERLDFCKIEDVRLFDLIDTKIRECVSKNDNDDNIAKSLQETAENYFKETVAAVSKNQSEAIDTNNSIKAQLSIIYMDYNSRTKNALRKCRELYPGIEFTETVFGNEQYSEMNTKLSTELMAGAGPDIIIFGANTFKSLYKVAGSGIFTDLNELISKDNEFNRSDYYEDIFDCGIYDNKRFYIPLEFSIPYFRTTDLTLKKNNIAIEQSGLTLDSLHKLAQDFIKNNDNKNKSLFWCNFGFLTMMQISGDNFIDIKNRKTYFNTKKFIDLLKIYKDIYPSIATYDTCAKYNSYTDMTKEDKLIMAYDISNESPWQLWTYNSIYNGVIGDDMDIIPLTNNGDCYARIGDCIGINSFCKSKDAAFKFIKIILSRDLQKTSDSYGSYNLNLLLPINKQAYNEDINSYLSNNSSGFGSEYPAKELPKKLAEKMNLLVEKAKPEKDMDIEVRKIVGEALEDYSKGKASAEQTAKTIDQKVTLYLNE